jgi:hypothetical protein
MRKQVYYLILSLMLCLLALTCCKKKASKYTVSNSNLKVDTEVSEYNQAIAKLFSLKTSDTVEDSDLINIVDIDKLRYIVDKNKEARSVESVDVTEELKPFLDELQNEILYRYGEIHYPNEFNGAEFDTNTYVVKKLSEEELQVAKDLNTDIANLWAEYESATDYTDELLDKIYNLCERYRALSNKQKANVTNSGLLANLVESSGGSLETNFNLEYEKWNTKKLRGEDVGEYTGATNEELGIVQGRRMYGEIPETQADTEEYEVNVGNIDTSDTTGLSDTDTHEYTITFPDSYLECVIDTGSKGTNKIDFFRLLDYITDLDKDRLYSENGHIYVRNPHDSTDIIEIKLLDWGKLVIASDTNEYYDYTVKDYVYWGDGKFKVTLLSTDSKDTRIVTGYIKDKKIYFDEIEKVVPEFKSLSVSAVENIERDLNYQEIDREKDTEG